MYTLLLPIPDIANREFSANNEKDNVEKGTINEVCSPR
jgi:hypothetical protein